MFSVLEILNLAIQLEKNGGFDDSGGIRPPPAN